VAVHRNPGCGRLDVNGTELPFRIRTTERRRELCSGDRIIDYRNALHLAFYVLSGIDASSY